MDGWIQKGKYGLTAEDLFAEMCMRRNEILELSLSKKRYLFHEYPKSMQLANDILIKISANDAAREKQFRSAELTLGSFTMQT